MSRLLHQQQHQRRRSWCSKLLVTTSLILHLVSPCHGFFFNGPSLANAKIPTTASTTMPSNIKLLILPGFGNDSKDYTLDGTKSLVSSLQQKGWPVEQISVLPVQRTDWLQVFWQGASDWKFWQGTAPPTRRAFAWYLERIAKEMASLDDDEQMVLVGHSAGGWLGRAAIGFGSLSFSGEEQDDEDVRRAPPIDISKVAGIVTLGAPNLPPPPEIMDMTRGALRITHQRFPGTYHSKNRSNNKNKNNNNMFYITVVGVAVRGEPQVRNSPWEPTTRTGFAFNSYESVCGDGTTIGDGVVPQCSAHLDGAIQLNLEGVLHSINAPDSWYGSIGVIDSWHGTMMEQLVVPPTSTLKLPLKWPFPISHPAFETNSK
jgi:hypothetical protein